MRKNKKVVNYDHFFALKRTDFDAFYSFFSSLARISIACSAISS